MTMIDRSSYASSWGSTAGDRVRLGDTLLIEVGKTSQTTGRSNLEEER